MSCSSGVIVFLVLFAIVTCCLEVYCLYFLHALIVSSSRTGSEILVFCLTLLLLAINGFAALCPCYDDEDSYVELTTFWFPLFYGVQSSLVLLAMYHKLCAALSGAAHLKVFERTKSLYHVFVAVVLAIVLLLTLALGPLGPLSLGIFIVVLLLIHVATIGLFLQKLMAIYRESGRSYDRAISLNNEAAIGSVNAASPRPGSSTRGGGAAPFAAEQGSPRALATVSTVSLLAAPVTALIRMATVVTISLCVHIAFVIWWSAILGDDDGAIYPAVATLMFFASSADVAMHFGAALRLHDSMEKEMHFCVRSVPHSFRHPLQTMADTEEAAEKRRAAAAAAMERQHAPFPLTDATRNAIIRYDDGQQTETEAVPDGDGQQLDRYAMQTIEDHASYNRDEDQLNILLDDELAKSPSRSPENGDTINLRDSRL